MSGTVEGGYKAAKTNKQRYGEDFYRVLGRMGGAVSRGGGFAKNRQLAVEAGRKGGMASRRPPDHKLTKLPDHYDALEPKRWFWKK